MSNAAAPAGVDLSTLSSIFPALAAASTAAAAPAPAAQPRDKSKVWVNIGFMGVETNDRTGEQIPTFYSILGFGLDEDKLERPLNGSAFKNRITKLENEKRAELYDFAMSGLEPGQEVILAADPTNGLMIQLRRVREEVEASAVVAAQTAFTIKPSTVFTDAAKAAAEVEAA